MTLEQAKQYAQQIATDSKPGPNGEDPRLTKAQALSAAALLGARLAERDPETGAFNMQAVRSLQDGMEAAVLLRDPAAQDGAAALLRDPAAAAFSEKILALDPETVDFAVALHAGAQHVVYGRGGQIDSDLQADLADVVADAAVIEDGSAAQLKG